MIAKLTGKVAGYYGNIVILDIESNNCSVGYELNCKTSDIALLHQGENITFYIKEIIKEDDDVLYGFLSFEDKCWFEEFIKISGLGPKTALAILSNYSCEAITEAILTNNCDFFSSISGIGGKIANRIPIEMKKVVEKINQKVLSFSAFSTDYLTLSSNNTNKSEDVKITTDKMLLNVDNKTDAKNNLTKTATKKEQNGKTNVKSSDKNTIINDAVNALIALGFSRQSVYNDVFSIVKKSDNISTEEIVKEFLKKIEK